MIRLLASLALLLLSTLVSAQTFSGVPRIIDGDTLEIDGAVIRLLDIDAPETRQKCRIGGKSIKIGVEALNQLKALTEDGVTCNAAGEDNYNRFLSACSLADGSDLSQAMALSGWAWAFTRFNDTYLPAEKQAAHRNLGVHGGDCEKSWDFRARIWAEGSQEAPDPNCPIKGNVSKRNGTVNTIYHTPWSEWYARTKINTKNCATRDGRRYCEQWFCDEKQATDAGWRAPQR